MYDILIRGGTLFDGAGHPGGAGDLAIESGRIAVIGGTVMGAAHKTIDAEGLAVTKEFIDVEPVPISRYQSIRKPKARSAKASPPKSSAIAAFRSHRC